MRSRLFTVVTVPVLTLTQLSVTLWASDSHDGEPVAVFVHGVFRCHVWPFSSEYLQPTGAGVVSHRGVCHIAVRLAFLLIPDRLLSVSITDRKDQPVKINVEWTVQEDGSWDGVGSLYGASVTLTEDGKYAATLFAPTPATRWEPDDVTEVAERVFTTLDIARAWVLAKEVEATAGELLTEVDIEECDASEEAYAESLVIESIAAAEAYGESAAGFYDESAAAAVEAAIDSRRV